MIINAQYWDDSNNDVQQTLVSDNKTFVLKLYNIQYIFKLCIINS